MYLNADTLIYVSKLLTALGVITAAALSIIKVYLNYKKQKAEIEKLSLENAKQNEELTLVCFGLSACLDGLIQLGCNHTVTTAKDKLDKYINNSAHNRFRS